MARSISLPHMKNSLDYVVKNEKDHVFLSADGVDISSKKSMIDDFQLYQKERVKNEFVTAVISPSPNDKLHQEAMQKLLQTVLMELKLDNRQYFSVIHQNTDNPHIHVILNRIDYDGNTWNDHHVAWKCQKACLDVCNKLKLSNAYEDTPVKSDGIKQNEYDSTRSKITKEINSLFNDVKFHAKSIQEIHNHLENNGVKVDIKKFPNGLYGCNFTYKGSVVKASKVNRLLSLKANGESFAPSPKLQEILNRNIERINGDRTLQDIKEDIHIHPENKVELLQEMRVMMFTINTLLDSVPKQASQEDDDAPILAKPKKKSIINRQMR